jgi:hypothetical protein
MNLRLLPLIAVFYFLSLSFVLAETKTIENSGFAPGNLWFSRVPTEVGEVVQVYTLVWNGSTNYITGTVSFFDNDSIIDKQDFVLAGAGNTKILSANWTAEEGRHNIYAEITDSHGGPRASEAVSVSLQYAKTAEEEHFVSAPAAVSADTPAMVLNIIGGKASSTLGYLEASLPKPVIGTAQFVVDNLESLRTGAKVLNEQAIINLKKNLASTTVSSVASVTPDKSETKTSDTGFSIEGPMKYAALAFLSVSDYILGNGWLFYGSGLVVVFFTLRFIKRKFFF